MNKNNVILLILAILFFIFASLFAYSSFTDKAPNNIASNADQTQNKIITEEDFFDSIEYENFTDFKFKDESNNELKISSYLGKPITILFSDFTENSEESNNFKTILESFYEDYKDDIQFFCIDKNDIQNYNSDIKLYKDIDGNEKYNIEQLPTLLFIDSEGNIINQVTAITEDSMEANLDLTTGNY